MLSNSDEVGWDFSVLALHLHSSDFLEDLDCTLEREDPIMEYNDRNGWISGSSWNGWFVADALPGSGVDGPSKLR